MEAVAVRGGGPWLCGSTVSLADLTLFPTFVYFCFYLPEVFKWPDVFHNRPTLRAWYTSMPKKLEAAARVQADLQATLVADQRIVQETSDTEYKWIYP